MLLADGGSLTQIDRTQFERLLVIPLFLIRVCQHVERFEIERLPRARLTQVIEQLKRFVQLPLVRATPRHAVTDFRGLGLQRERLLVQRRPFLPTAGLIEMRGEPSQQFGVVRELRQRSRAKGVRFLVHVERQVLRMSHHRGLNGRLRAMFFECPRNGQLPRHLVLLRIGHPMTLTARA